MFDFNTFVTFLAFEADSEGRHRPFRAIQPIWRSALPFGLRRANGPEFADEEAGEAGAALKQGEAAARRAEGWSGRVRTRGGEQAEDAVEGAMRAGRPGGRTSWAGWQTRRRSRGLRG